MWGKFDFTIQELDEHAMIQFGPQTWVQIHRGWLRITIG
jgi:hypothetical protein